MSITEGPTDVVLRDGVDGHRVVAVEPGGAEFIPLAETVLPQVGDIAFGVGFLVSGAVYLLLRRTMR